MNAEQEKFEQEEGIQPVISRRNFLKISAIGGGAVVASGLAGVAIGTLLGKPRATGEGLPVPESDAPSEELLVGDVDKFLRGLDEKVEEIYRMRRRWYGANSYITQEGDSLDSIAQNIGRKPEEILDIGFNLEFRNADTDEPLSPRQELYLPESIYPSLATKKIFDRARRDQDKLKLAIHEFDSESPEVEQVANEIWKFWHTAPGESEEVKSPTLYLDPKTGKNGEWIAHELKGFLEAVNNPGRGIMEVYIIPIEDNPNMRCAMFTASYEDKGATVWVLEKNPDTPGSYKEWTRRDLLNTFAHDFLGHALSLYSSGYNLRFLTPAEAVELVHEDTILWNTFHSMFPNDGVVVEERHAGWLQLFFMGEENENLDPEFLKQVEKHYNRIISKILDYSFNLDELAKELGLR